MGEARALTSRWKPGCNPYLNPNVNLLLTALQSSFNPDWIPYLDPNVNLLLTVLQSSFNPDWNPYLDPNVNFTSNGITVEFKPGCNPLPAHHFTFMVLANASGLVPLCLFPLTWFWWGTDFPVLHIVCVWCRTHLTVSLAGSLVPRHKTRNTEAGQSRSREQGNLYVRLPIFIDSPYNPQVNIKVPITRC